MKARESQSDQYAISLFPMFNILICTLGVLIFILGAVATLTLGVGKSALILLPDGMDGTSGIHEKVPHYIEWDGSSLIVHPGKESVRFEEDVREIDTFEKTYAYMDMVISGSSLDKLIHNIGQSNGNDYVVLLVRPSGFKSLYEVRGYLESKGVRLGYEPVGQGWSLRVPE